jgi:hypothetical protein
MIFDPAPQFRIGHGIFMCAARCVPYLLPPSQAVQKQIVTEVPVL